MKKIIIGIISFVIAFILVFCYLVSKDLKVEEEVKREIKEINTLLKQDNIDYNKINQLLDRTVSKGDYRLVELSAKLYIKDYINKYKQIINITNSEEMQILLAPNNLEKNKYNFEILKEQINKSIQDLNLYKKEFLMFYQEDKVMSYLDPSLDEYYQDFYSTELIGTVGNSEEVESSIEKILNNLKMANSIIDLLEENIDKWYVKNGEIYLDDSILDEYNSYVKYITSESDNDFSDAL